MLMSELRELPAAHVAAMQLPQLRYFVAVRFKTFSRCAECDG
jgi:hypothetical protein